MSDDINSMFDKFEQLIKELVYPAIEATQINATTTDIETV